MNHARRERNSPTVLTSWSNTAGKHEVEQLWLADFIIRIRVPKIILSAEISEFRTRKVVELHQFVSLCNCQVQTSNRT
jgi:hypothetical protein